MKRVAVLLSVLFLSSCNLSRYYVPTTVKELLPVGSHLRLTQAIEIPADRSTVYIAGGRVMPFKNYNTVDVYKPYCEFGPDGESSQPRRVLPDRFEITRIVEWEKYLGSLETVRVASAAEDKKRRPDVFGVGTLFEDDGGPSIVMYATILSLRSDNQPEIKKMVCGHWEELGKVEPLTLEQLKSALGGLIVVEE